MSAVLRERIRAFLVEYQVSCRPLLDFDELAAEILDAVLPASGVETEPIWAALVHGRDICMNCLCSPGQCGCCPGCGQPDADIIGSHGYWCAL